ncbi:MAG: GntR family transcriptional regulator [Pseudomonadota bacterium]|nr:GntR family transcriptional regulator [Pseudomonadota bacterium]
MAIQAPVTAIAERRPGFSERNGTLYAQVANVIRQRIRSGQWGAGSQIPVLGVLEKEFGVARVTLRQALNLLENEGLIWRRQGRGTFVSDTAGPEWCRMETSRDQLIHSLEGNWVRLIDVDGAESAPRLDAGDGEPANAYRHMRRLHGKGNFPYAVVDMHLDKALYERAPDRFDRQMIIPVLERLPGFSIGEIRQTLTIGTADREVAEHLGVAIGSPIGIMRRLVRDGEGRVAYVGVVNYRGDLVKLEITMSDGERTRR